MNLQDSTPFEGTLYLPSGEPVDPQPDAVLADNHVAWKLGDTGWIFVLSKHGGGSVLYNEQGDPQPLHSEWFRRDYAHLYGQAAFLTAAHPLFMDPDEFKRMQAERGERPMSDVYQDTSGSQGLYQAMPTTFGN